MLQRLFRLEARGTTAGREFAAGTTTFAAMAYILAVNPLVLANAGMDREAVVLATGLAAALGCFLMAALANYPIALAPGMGTNAYFAYIVVLGMGLPWQAALALTFWNGLFFLLLSVSGLRKRLADAIPFGLQVGIQAGIGFFIALLGLKAADLVVASPATIIGHGDFASPAPLLALAGLFLMCLLSIRRVPGAILLSIAAVAAAALLLRGADGEPIAQMPERLVAFPSGLDETFLQLDWLYPFSHPAALEALFTLLVLDLFDSLGTIIGVSRRVGLVDGQGRLPKMSQALAADALATIAGAALGTSTTTSYIESAAGVEAGGRTGLVSVVVGLLFLAALPFSPLIAAAPALATAPALVFVGLLMGQSLRHLPYHDTAETLAAILTAIAIPLFFSITHGLALGLLLYIALRLGNGRAREVGWIAYAMAALFIVFYAVGS